MDHGSPSPFNRNTATNNMTRPCRLRPAVYIIETMRQDRIRMITTTNPPPLNCNASINNVIRVHANQAKPPYLGASSDD